MILNAENLKNITNAGQVEVPLPSFAQLPEKVLQFGTGVLLRGLPDYFIHKANQTGIFNGRVVVVKSTDQGDTISFAKQDNLYTLCVRGIEAGEKVEENILCSAISRVLSATSQWAQILEFAADPELTVVVSNTTEVGIQLVEDSIQAQPPISFPGKLLAVLWARYQAFAGDSTKGLVILPTELIPDNGIRLREIIWQLASQNQLDAHFKQWLTENNIFCNTLVDRIVPGKPEAMALTTLQQELGYQDDLLAIAEVYRLWAIEGEKRVQQVLSFAQADAGVVIAPDIHIFRELKLRLLNGTHTLSCGVAFLAGLQTVKQAMENELMADFICKLMQEEIAPAIPYPVEPAVALDFSQKVLDRFRNPHLEHQWLSITLNYTSKLKMRVVPVLLRYYELFHHVPENMALGFAAYLQFMQVKEKENNKYYGVFSGNRYVINDDTAPLYYELSQQADSENFVLTVLQNQELWGVNLAALPGFTASVQNYLTRLQENDIENILREMNLARVKTS
ncbi:altronate oxidoreductase [Adhaeribacter arboris]|uniref:Altronate oxidoreductase n=1 Tax=Adhaeribacter arboris TaxID=2072846 RepID=A0A2T2YAF0_9BACT|nr:tagaturonate reductase [Adhaeribacter arboris]PSR52495.1 altronate oxidoreductase [Adhaeribacter arboris]